MYELKQIGKVFTSKFVGTGPSSYKKKNLPGRGLMYELKQIGKVFTSKFVGTGPSSYKKKIIYRAAVSQRLRNTALRAVATQGHKDQTNIALRDIHSTACYK